MNIFKFWKPIQNNQIVNNKFLICWHEFIDIKIFIKCFNTFLKSGIKLFANLFTYLTEI